MPDHDSSALWAAIRATPDDDLPRLALADWLDENEGEAGQARARLIRVQCELAHLERGEGPYWRIGTLQKEAERLIRKHKETLLAGLPVGNGFALYFRRGMPEDAVARTGKDFLKRAEKAFAAAPITSLRFSAVTVEELQAVIAGGWLRRVQDLHLHSNEYRGGPALEALVGPLSASEEVSGLRALGFTSQPRPGAATPPTR
jgi:uncharacterized protein (TIGR02996 family)